jgi:protein required for attachment to host cells
MDRLTIPHEGWVVVCDGVKALVLRNDGDAEHLALTLLQRTGESLPPTHELGTERPGRVFKSASSVRSAVEPTDLHDEAETAFLVGVAERLNHAVLDRKVAHVALVAPPRALGVLRKHLSNAARSAIVREVGKDLAGLSVPDITRHLAA